MLEEEFEISITKPARKIDISLRNLGTVNKNAVDISSNRGDVRLFFSYETLVGVRGFGEPKIAKNIWSATTGKLLNELEPDHKKRVPHEEVLATASHRLKQVVC